MKSIKQYLKKITFLNKVILKTNKVLISRPSPIKGLNNEIINDGHLKNVVYDIMGNNNKVRIGKNTYVNNTLIFIRGDYHNLIIEDNCFFGEGELWMEDDHCSIIIHSHTTVERAHLAVTESFSVLEIHNDCMLAKNVEIRTGDSHSIVDMKSGKRINKAANVTLKEHVWIGAHAKILKGVTIGNNSVIGTSSLVTADIPAHSVAAGIPAKVIRSGIDWKRERILE